MLLEDIQEMRFGHREVNEEAVEEMLVVMDKDANGTVDKAEFQT